MLSQQCQRNAPFPRLRSCFRTNVFNICPMLVLWLCSNFPESPPEFEQKKKKPPIVSVNGSVDALLLFGQLVSEAGKGAGSFFVPDVEPGLSWGSAGLPSCHSTQFDSLLPPAETFVFTSSSDQWTKQLRVDPLTLSLFTFSCDNSVCVSITLTVYSDCRDA